VQFSGYSKQKGKSCLDVENIQLSRPSEAVQALIGGSINFAWASADAFINAIEAGGNVAIIGQAIGNPAFSVVVQPSRAGAKSKARPLRCRLPKTVRRSYFA
jgi:ABC-type nitrate/sulfonate/bicarbonate transport system substrate-binding protein